MNALSAAGRAAPVVFCLFISLFAFGVSAARPQDAALAIERGQALEAAEKLDQAIVEYSKAIAADPASAEGWVRRGNARIKVKLHAAALEDLDRAIRIDPSNAEAHKCRAGALNGLQRFKEGIPAATRAIELQPGYSAAYYQRGYARFRLLDFAGAADDESRAIEAKPDNWEAFRIRGVARVELKQHRAALADLDVALERKTIGRDSTLLYRGIARQGVGDVRGALEDANASIELNPTYPRIYLYRGNYRQALGDRAGAEEDYRKALALAPKFKDAADALAALNAPPAATASPAEAAAPARGAVALPPLDPREVDDLSRFPNEVKLLSAFRASPTPEARDALGRVRFDHALRLTASAEKQLDEPTFATALAYAESAVALAPDNHAIWLLLGRLYAAIEENPVAAGNAEQAYRAALEIRPGLAAARLGLAQLYFRRGSFDRALNELEPALTSTPALATPEAVSMMGWAYICDFQLERGIAYFRDLLAKNPKTEPPVIGLAVLLHENGARADAERTLNALAGNASATAATREYAKALLADWAKGGAR